MMTHSKGNIDEIWPALGDDQTCGTCDFRYQNKKRTFTPTAP